MNEVSTNDIKLSLGIFKGKIMNYLLFGFSFFVIFIKFSSTHFMAGFENGMRQFENNMQQFNQHMKDIFGDSGQHHRNVEGGKNWLKQFANPQIPVFPQNFPFPPQCTRVEDVPGLQYASPDEGVNININTYPPAPVTTTYEYVTYECTDPRFPESFYMLKSTVHFQVGRSGSSSDSSSGKVKYYHQDGTEFQYHPEVKSKPLWN